MIVEIVTSLFASVYVIWVRVEVGKFTALTGTVILTFDDLV